MTRAAVIRDPAIASGIGQFGASPLRVLLSRHTRRRAFITLLGGAATRPLATRAQQAGKLPTIGFLGSNTPSTQSQWTAAFVQRLRELGWTEGRTVAIEYRWAEGRTERAAEIATEFVRLKVDVIVTHRPAVATLRSSPSSSRLRSTRSAAASSQVWRSRAAAKGIIATAQCPATAC